MCDYQTVFQDTDELREIYYHIHIKTDYPEIELDDFLENKEYYLQEHPGMIDYNDWMTNNCIQNYMNKYDCNFVIAKDCNDEFEFMTTNQEIRENVFNYDNLLCDLEDNFIRIHYNFNKKRFDREKKQKEKKINDFISSRLYNPRTPWGKIFVNNLYMKDC